MNPWSMANQPGSLIQGVNAMRILVEPWCDCVVALLAVGHARGFKVSTSQYYVGLAILLVLVALASVQAYRMWEEIHDVEEPDSPDDLLETFEEAHALGELDDEEFARVRRRLASPSADEGKMPPATDHDHDPEESDES
jgi:uncharacterized membrane protein